MRSPSGRAAAGAAPPVRAPAGRGGAGPAVVRPEPPEGWAAWVDGVYRRLLSAFGPRHWWPSALEPAPARAEPFEMIAGAILVQNVAWSNAAKAVRALAEARLLDVAAMHAAPAEAVEPLIRPAAYFKQKAQRLKAFAAHVVAHYGGDLAAMLRRPLGELREELLSLPGIGPETADCILCYAAGLPVMAMDAYTRRIFARMGVFAPDIRYDQMQAFFHAWTPEDAGLRGEFHALIDTLGSRICLKREPRCGECPLADRCARVGVAGQGGGK
nr:MAG: endonuclease [Bacillota bacterium]